MKITGFKFLVAWSCLLSAQVYSKEKAKPAANFQMLSQIGNLNRKSIQNNSDVTNPSFREGISNLQIQKSNKQGPGDYGGSDDVKTRILNLRSKIINFLDGLKSAEDLKLFKNTFDEESLQFLTSEMSIKTEINNGLNYKMIYGLNLKTYLKAMQLVFIDQSCLVGDYPFSFRLELFNGNEIGYACISRSMIQKNSYSDEELMSYLIHETLHYMGIRDHTFAQKVADDIVSAMIIVPTCTIPLKLETKSRCKLVTTAGSYLVSLYKTSSGLGISLNDDKYVFTKTAVRFQFDVGQFDSYKSPSLSNINLGNYCPAESPKTLKETLKILSERQYYADILIGSRHYFDNSVANEFNVVIGVSPAANENYGDYPYVNLSHSASGIGNPAAYRPSPSVIGYYIDGVICIIPRDSLEKKNL